VETFSSLECLQLLLKNKPKAHNVPQNSPFDVIILLHPFILFSDAISLQNLNKHEYKMEFSNFTHSIFQLLSQDLFMSREGILAAHLGPSPYLNRRSKKQQLENNAGIKHLQLELIAQMTGGTGFKKLHLFEDSHGATRVCIPQSYAVLCKGDNCEHNWYADEAYISYQMCKRLSSYPSIIDGATLMRYNRPPKSWESLFCSFPRNKRQCKYMTGFDPSLPNIYHHEFEVRPSLLGENAGHGLLAKVDIVEGSYCMLEVFVHLVRFSVYSIELASNTREMLNELDDDDDDDNDVDGAADVSQNSDSFSEDELGWYEIHVTRDVHKYEIDSFLTYLEGRLLKQQCLILNLSNFP
jgi:hypothetical protein